MLSKLSRGKKTILLIGVCILALIGINNLIRVRKDTYFSRELEKIYALSTSTSSRDLIDDGFVNVTGIHYGEDSKVEGFLSKVDKRQWGTLRTFVETEDDLLISIYNYDERIDIIRGIKYYVKHQRGWGIIAHYESYHITEDGEINTVILKNTPNKQYPDWESHIIIDDVLYSYRVED